MTFVGFTLLTPSAWAEGGAAGVLNGAAAIVSAGGQIAAAGIAAGADKAVAGINAKANVEMTRISNDTIRDTNQTNATIALAQTYSSAAIAAINNAGATERQGMISMESILASKDKYRTEREKAWMDYEYNVAKLLMEDKGRQQQLELDQQGKDMLAAVKRLTPTGANGGLEITRYNDSLLLGGQNAAATTTEAEPTLTAAKTLAQAVTGDETTAQDRLARAVASTTPSMAQKLAQFKNGKRGSKAALALPKMILASGNLERSTAKVRGSSANKILAIQDPPKVASLNSVSFRAARRGFDGIPHNASLGRNNSSPTHGGGDGGGEEGGHHSHKH